MGSLALSRHDFASGVEWGRRALAQAPRSYVAYGILADGYTELGRYDEAVDALQQMIDLRPDQTSYSRVSYARELHGDLANAIVAMQQAVDSGGPRAEGTNWSRVQLGNLSFNSGDLDAAELQYRASLYFLPNYVHGLAGQAKVAAARGDLKGAAKLYEQALAIMPWPEYAIALGDVYRAMGNESAARRQDDLVRVISQLQRAGGVDVDLEMALFEADHAQDAASLAAALQNARAVYAHRPSVHAADVLAWTLHRAGQPAEALPFAREALRLGTKDPLMLFHAGAIAAAAGEPSEAKGYLEAALAQNPQFSVRYAPEARQLLAQVQRSA
jgi:pentatricopeptide repeat protein